MSYTIKHVPDHPYFPPWQLRDKNDVIRASFYSLSEVFSSHPHFELDYTSVMEAAYLLERQMAEKDRRIQSLEEAVNLAADAMLRLVSRLPSGAWMEYQEKRYAEKQAAAQPACKCGSSADEDGYCRTPGCPNMGKTVEP